MMRMLAVARALTALLGRKADERAGLAGAGWASDETIAAKRMMGPNIMGIITQCAHYGYRPVYFCAEMERSPKRLTPVASGGPLC
jgi:hypothetical protein